MRHISIRVPWHDNKWNGTICCKPSCNMYCMNYPRIFDSKNSVKEDARCGASLHDLKSDYMPACQGENGFFMSEASFTRIMRHPYSWHDSGPHADLLPTPILVEPYSCFAVPFNYLRKQDEQNKWFFEQHPEFSADEDAPFNTAWIYGRDLQEEVLTWFKKDIVPHASLVTFYCKNNTPIDEDSQRIIVGIGEIDSVSQLNYYNSKSDITYPFWDMMMSHTIRQDLKKSSGFLLPYHEYLALDDKVARDKTGKSKYELIDEIKITLDKLGNSRRMFDELSYGCNHVSNRNMLTILGVARKCLEHVVEHNLVKGDWSLQIRWIDEKIGEIKKATGPFPAFAEALRAIGIDYAYLIEQDLREEQNCGVKDNPWSVFDTYMESKNAPRGKAYYDEWHLFRRTWKGLSEKCIQVLELLSRFEINEDKIRYWIEQPSSYDEILENPYILSEEEEYDSEDAITPEMIDFGVFEDQIIQGKCLPTEPSVVRMKLDERRIRAIAVDILKQRLLNGDTLVSLNEVEEYVEDSLKTDEHRLPRDYFKNYKDFMSVAIEYIDNGDSFALQLPCCKEWETKVSKIFKARTGRTLRSKRQVDWDSIVKRAIPGYDSSNVISEAALKDQCAALQKMYDRKLSVLTGAAGTGKTSVVRAFLQSDVIRDEGVLLLAPTGKARVRLGNMGVGYKALTIAQFLSKQGFFDWDRTKVIIPDEYETYDAVGNVIIDECSMLTTYDFYALFMALDMAAVKRIILIGDQYQLPPIGPGRPFADLCAYLSNEVKDAYANLTTVVRTITTGESDILQLARWFSGNKPQKDDDSIFEKMEQGDLHNDLTIYKWANVEELEDKLYEVFDKEMPAGESFSERFLRYQGLDDLDDALEHPEKVEKFQILSPVIGPVWGTYNINGTIQEWKDSKNYPVTMVNETIGYAEKVIQLKNEIKRCSYPNKDSYQLSNGQVGFVYRSWPRDNKLQIAYSGIKQRTFDFYGSKKDDAEQNIELAYAITIHKSQGSDFETVLVVLPKSCPLLSRELIYTALTRAKKHLILFVEDNTAWLRSYTKPSTSVLAKRNTNMFGKCSVRNSKADIPYADGLIHKTLDGTFVRSKSEVLIANELYNNKLQYEYEKELEEDGHRCIPDFSFVDAAGDRIIWEHLGMLDIPSYKQAWDRKKEFYESIGYYEGENLFTTQDHEGAIDSTEIMDVIEQIKDLID